MNAQGGQMERARPIGAMCMAISVRELDDWLVTSNVGDEIVYATGAVLDRDRDVVIAARTYAAEGEIRTHQRRGPHGRWEYFAVRRSPDPDRRRGRGARQVAAQPAIDPESTGGRILAIFRRCISLRLPARTNAEIARELGLKDHEAARYQIGLLVEAGHISVRGMGPRERRIVTLNATGQSTRKGAL